MENEIIKNEEVEASSVEKYLGKIVSAEYGVIPDYPFLMGLLLTFAFDSKGVGCGGKYTVNMSPECKWESDEKRMSAMENSMRDIYKLLNEAKTHSVSGLVNKPVEIAIENDRFKSFRILTEVL